MARESQGNLFKGVGTAVSLRSSAVVHWEYALYAGSMADSVALHIVRCSLIE